MIVRSRHRERQKLDFIPEANGGRISLPGGVISEALTKLAGQDVTAMWVEAREHTVVCPAVIWE